MREYTCKYEKQNVIVKLQDDAEQSRLIKMKKKDSSKIKIKS
jgi:hypothetical protein